VGIDPFNSGWGDLRDLPYSIETLVIRLGEGEVKTLIGERRMVCLTIIWLVRLLTKKRFIRLMSTLKWINDLQLAGVGSWYLFGVTVGRPSLFQEVRGWGTPWPDALPLNLFKGRTH
jgi:hypothetical protein